MDRAKMTPGGYVHIIALVIALAMVVVGQPVMNGNGLKNIACKRGEVVANVHGYVTLLSENFTRHSLDFNKVDQSRSVIIPDKRYLQLSGDEFRFDIDYVHQDKGESNGRFQFSNLVMSVRAKNSGAQYSQICSFDEKFTFALPEKLRYSCTEELSHQCSSDGHVVANLVLITFELDLEGNPDKVKKLEFTKDPWAESCEHWDM